MVIDEEPEQISAKDEYLDLLQKKPSLLDELQTHHQERNVCRKLITLDLAENQRQIIMENELQKAKERTQRGREKEAAYMVVTEIELDTVMVFKPGQMNMEKLKTMHPPEEQWTSPCVRETEAQNTKFPRMVTERLGQEQKQSEAEMTRDEMIKRQYFNNSKLSDKHERLMAMKGRALCEDTGKDNIGQMSFFSTFVKLPPIFY